MDLSEEKLKKVYQILRPYDHDDFSYNPNICDVITNEITKLKDQNNIVKLLLLNKILGMYVLSEDPQVLTTRLLNEIRKLCVDHKVDNNYHKNQIKKLYEFVYPYGEFDGNYADSCIAINKELNILCRNNNKNILTAISLGLGLSANKYDTTNTLCEKLLDIVNTSCFSIDDITSARVATNFGLGVYLPKQEDEITDIDTVEIKSVGFKNPIYVNDTMKNFIANADFGYIIPNDPNSGKLNSVLQVTQNNISTRAMLITLFSIYVRVNNMNIDQNKYKSTSDMNKYFQETYQNLMNRPQRYLKGPDGNPDLTKPIPKFDPNNFKYTAIQLIIGDNVIPTRELTKDQTDYLKNPKVINRLNAEYDLVIQVLGTYRQQ